MLNMDKTATEHYKNTAHYYNNTTTYFDNMTKCFDNKSGFGSTRGFFKNTTVYHENTTTLYENASDNFNVTADGFPRVMTPELCESEVFHRFSQVVIATVMFLVISSNLLMIVVILRSANPRINPYFFMSLAMSDLLTGFLVLPFCLGFSVYGETRAKGQFEGEAFGISCTISGNLFHIFQATSLFSFFALSVDRYVSIVYPLKYVTLLTPRTNVIIVVALWGTNVALYGAIPAFEIGHYRYKCWQAMCNLEGTDRTYIIFNLMLCTAVVFATYGLFIRIYLIARQQASRIAAIEQRFYARSGQEMRLRSSIKAAKAVVYALGLYSVCWGSYYSALFSFILFGAKITPLTEFTLLWIAISNSYMNFFVFLRSHKPFRLEFLRLFKRNKDRPIYFTSSTSTQSEELRRRVEMPKT